MAFQGRALVTGAAGFIGSRVSGRLLEAGFEVVGLDDLSNGSESSVPEGVRFIRGSVTDPGAVREAAAGADVILHFAARIGTRESASQFLTDGDTNIMGTLNLLSICTKSRVRRFVYPSSAAVYGEGTPGKPVAEDQKLDPLSPYGVSKLAAEMYVSRICATSGIDYVVLRYFNAYGPGQKYGPYAGVITLFAENVLAGRLPVIYGDGEQVRDFVFIDDVVRATVMAVVSGLGGEVLNIGTGKPCTVNRLASLVLGEMGSSLEPEYAPPLDQEIRYSLADPQKAAVLLGFTAEKSLEEGIAETVAWFKQRS